jgi:DUF4097 and DUF4098 domain-containing protein YvlB
MKMQLYAAAAALALLPGVATGQDFNWRGSLAPGQAIEIKGVNGDIRAEPAGGNQVEVVADKSARRDNPDSVKIEVVPHAGGVTICAVYPSRQGAQPNQCAPGKGGRMNVQNNDVNVRFTVRVPAGVTLVGKTVNGEIEALRLNGNLDLTTVNGGVTFSTTSVARANTVNGSIRGEMGQANWSDELDMKTVNGGITLTLPPGLDTDLRAATVNGDISSDFEVAVRGRITRRRLEGTIGGGGRSLSLETVNGGITLKRS